MHMISKKIESAFNKQIAAEQYSAMLYLALAAYYESKNLKGFSAWLRVQYEEELTHAMKFFDFILERGGVIELSALPKPPAKFPPVHQAFALAYEHEQKVTGMIHGLYELALKEKDYPAQSFLKWFVDEQVEEEANTLEITEKLKLIGEKSNGIFMLDHQLGKRGKD